MNLLVQFSMKGAVNISISSLAAYLLLVNLRTTSASSCVFAIAPLAQKCGVRCIAEDDAPLGDIGLSFSGALLRDGSNSKYSTSTTNVLNCGRR